MGARGDPWELGRRPRARVLEAARVPRLRVSELWVKLFLLPGGSGGKGDVPPPRAGNRMNLVSVAAEPELKWVTLWGRVRWAAVLVLLLGSLMMLLLPLAAVEDQCQAVLEGLSFLKSKLGTGSSGVTRYTGQTTGLSVSSNGLELLVLKGKAPPGKRGERSRGAGGCRGALRAPQCGGLSPHPMISCTP